MNTYILKKILTIAAIAFCLYYFYRNREIITQLWDSVSYSYLLLSFVCGLAGYTLLPFCICELYRGREDSFQKILYPKFCYIYYIANIYKYIPGKISTLYMYLNEGKQQGLKGAALFQAWAAANALMLMTGMMLAIGVIFPFIENRISSKIILACVLLCLTGIIIPPVNTRIMKILFSVFRRDHHEFEAFTYSSLIKAFFLQILSWGAIGLSFAAVVHAYIPTDAKIAGLSVLAYPAAHSIAFLAFFAPAGLGVREGLLTAFLLKISTLSPVPAGPAAVLFVVVMHRLIMTLIDIVLIVLAAGIRHFFLYSDEPFENQ